MPDAVPPRADPGRSHVRVLPMAGPYHEGELLVQRRAGVAEEAARIGRAVRGTMPAAAQAFLAERRWLVVAGLDDALRPRVTMLAGDPGFLSTPDEGTLVVRAAADPGDPAAALLVPGRPLGALALDLATRRRLRLNGRIAEATAGRIVVRTTQVYANCPKYIQRREGEHAGVERAGRADWSGGRASLSAEERAWVRRADTLFVASAHPTHGADASHRGGPPGFLAVDGDRVTWTEYDGNMMFNTLGNLVVNPRAALAVPDFGTGSVLLLEGPAALAWGPDGPAPRTGRSVTVTVDTVRRADGLLPFRLTLRDASPYNP